MLLFTNKLNITWTISKKPIVPRFSGSPICPWFTSISKTWKSSNITPTNCSLGKTFWVSSYSQNPYWSGRLCTFDLLVITSFDEVLFILKILFPLFTKQATLTKRSTSLKVPWLILLPFVVKDTFTQAIMRYISSQLHRQRLEKEFLMKLSPQAIWSLCVNNPLRLIYM